MAACWEPSPSTGYSGNINDFVYLVFLDLDFGFDGFVNLVVLGTMNDCIFFSQVWCLECVLCACECRTVYVPNFDADSRGRRLQ